MTRPVPAFTPEPWQRLNDNPSYRPTHGHPDHYRREVGAREARDEARAAVVLDATAGSVASDVLRLLLGIGEERAA